VLTPARVGLFHEYATDHLTPVLGDAESVRAWLDHAEGPFHLEIDTGMGRTGVRWDEVDALAGILDSPRLEGCFTQFHSSDRTDGSAERQLERFTAGLARLRRRPTLVHVANSAAALRDRKFAFDAVRPGVYLYGGTPAEGLRAASPVVALRARVVSVRRVRAGESVSYNASWTAPRDSTIATLGVGYADGLARRLASNGRSAVLLHGRRCRVVGLVTMDFTMVEVGDAPVQVGDVATLVGEAGGDRITLDEFAEWSGRLQREFLTGLGSRLPRIYV
jgi:alanine racemase